MGAVSRDHPSRVTWGGARCPEGCWTWRGFDWCVRGGGELGIRRAGLGKEGGGDVNVGVFHFDGVGG